MEDTTAGNGRPLHAPRPSWLHEHNGRRFNRAVAVNLFNAALCAAMVVLIAVYRTAY